MKIIYQNGWTYEKILAFIYAHENMKKVLSHDYDDHYRLTFENGDTYENKYPVWGSEIPGEIKINGTVVQLTYDL